MTEPKDLPPLPDRTLPFVSRRAFVLGAISIGVGCAPGGAFRRDAGPTDSGVGQEADAEQDAGLVEADGGANSQDASAADDAGGDDDAGLDPTPQCGETLRDVVGPYYTADAPFRTDLIDAGMAGTPMRLAGTVFNTACEPIAGALIDLWQANDDGDYDNVGFVLRARLYADAQGQYELRTIVPGYYMPRPRHFHVRVSADGYTLLTTQLYFADDPQNNNPGTPREVLDLTLTPGPSGEDEAEFDFVLTLDNG